jgi:arylsulfatase A-like enzyme
MRALYAGEVTMVDRWIGRLLEKLQDLGLDRTTAVVIASDHGFMHGEHRLVGKNDMYREVSRLVTMVRHPEGRGAGRRARALVQPIDLFPSVVEMVGLPPPPELDGISWCRALDEEWTGREIAFSGSAASLQRARLELTHVQAYDGRWSLLDHPDPRRRELYDVRSDTAQATNLASAEPDVVARLHGALVEFYRWRAASSDDLGMLTGEIAVRTPDRPAGDTHDWVRIQLARRHFLKLDLGLESEIQARLLEEGRY